MPEDPVVWVLAILVGAAVIVVALVLGGMVEVGFNPLRLKFHRKAEGEKKRVSILDEAEIGGTGKIGSVTGVRRTETGEKDSHGGAIDVDVARKLKATDVEIGDITGIEVSRSSKSSGQDPEKRGSSGSDADRSEE